MPLKQIRLLFAGFILLRVSAQAALLLSDDFNYADGSLISVSSGQWNNHSGTSGQVDVSSGKVNLTFSESEDVNALLSGQPYTGSTNVLYASFVARFSDLPSGGGAYFAHFKDSGSTFRARIWATTNGATTGTLRLGISSTSGSVISATNATELSPNLNYTVVLRLYLNTSIATLWIDPSDENSVSVSSSETATTATVAAFALRQNSGIGQLSVDNLRIGTTFLDVFSPTVPTINIAPESQAISAGKNVKFFTIANGTPPLGYQWQFNGADINGATSSTLSLSNVTNVDAGNYSIVVSNSAGSVSASATLTVTEPGATVSILTYNVKGNGAADWSTNAAQVQAIGRQVAWLQPDVITFNEIPFPLTYEMTNFMKQYLPGYVMATNSGTDGYIRSVICSRFPITRSQKWLDGADLNSFGYTNSNFSRDLFEAQIAVPDFDQPLHVFTTHLKALSDADSAAKRAAEARAISNYFVTGFLTTNANRPYVLTGDLNEDINRPPGTSQQPIQKIVNASTGFQLTTPRNPFDNDDRTQSIQSGLTARFDYILPCELLFSNLATNQVFRTDLLSPTPPWLEQFDDETASDHLPVLAVFNNPYLPAGTAPVITNEPSSQTNLAGTTAQFSVGASGTEPLAYQWQKDENDLNDGGNILGATTPTLTLSNVSVADAGNYRVIVTNAFGLSTSMNASLVVPVPPAIQAQPTNQATALGGNVTLAVGSTGTQPLHYQWRFKSENISSATASSLSLTNVQSSQAGIYSVLITNLAGSAVSSNAYLYVTNAEAGKPVVTVLSPVANQRVTNDFTFLLSGTAKDNAGGLGVAQVVFKLNDGAFQVANGTTNWSATLNLTPGTNTLQVKVVDFGLNESLVVSQTFFAVAFSPFTLGTNGLGTITPAVSALGTPTNGALLEVGRPYKITATPGLDNVFSNWVGTAIYTNAALTFTMSSNMNLTANFVPNPFIPAAGFYNGLFYETNVPPAVTHHSAGYLTMKVKTNFIFSGKLLLDGEGVSISGKFNVDGTINKEFSRAKLGKTDLQVSLDLNFAQQDGTLTGQISAGTNWTAQLTADRAAYDKTNNTPAAFVGNYTMLLPPGTNALTEPAGYSYGLVNVTTNGFAKWIGGMGDTHVVGYLAPISANKEWPIYKALYKSLRVYTNLLKTTNLAFPVLTTNKGYFQGSVLGWLTFTNNAPGVTNIAPAGTLSWIKTGWTNAAYSQGFTNQNAIVASKYLAPPPGNRMLAITNGTITLSDGNLNAILTNGFTLKTNNTVLMTTTNNKVKLSLAAKNGLLIGSFQHSDQTNKVTIFKGAVLYEQNYGGGVFLGTNQSGAVGLQGD